MRARQLYLGRRLAVAGFLAVSVLPVLAATAAPSVGTTRCAAITPAPSNWQRIAAPRFPAGPQNLSAYAVSLDGGLLFATNGTVIERSSDGGCSWQSTYTLSHAPTASPLLLSSAAAISTLAAGPGGTVYAAIADLGHPHVVESNDNGCTGPTTRPESSGRPAR
jgi:hypothetical protein